MRLEKPMTKIIKIVALLGAVVLMRSDHAQAMENTGRYFPFSSRPEKSWYKKGSTFDVDCFYMSGQNIANEDSPASGMGDVGGVYDLNSVVAAMEQVNPQVTAEVKQLIGAAYAKCPLIFDAQGKMRGGGAVFRYAAALPSPLPITVGVSLPIVQLESDLRYSLNQRNFAFQYQKVMPLMPWGFAAALDDVTWSMYQERLDHARRVAHESMGLMANHSKQTGVGDLDLFARLNFVLDHRFLMRTVDLAIQFGVVAPTGFERLLNEPSSVPVMHDGHWSMYAQFLPTLELKQDFKIGLMLRGQHFVAQTRERRLPFFRESHLYSPLIGAVKVSPGSTLLVGGFLGLENLYDGMHLQFKYLYKAHHADQWQDVRSDKTIPSYLSRVASPAAPGVDAVTDEEIKSVIGNKQYLSKYRSHYITIQLTYDPLEAGQALPLSPKWYAAFQMPMPTMVTGRGAMEASQISFGAELHF